MALQTFGILHLIIIIASLTISYSVYKAFHKSKNKLLRYASSSLAGVVLGIVISYFLSHLITVILNNVGAYSAGGSANLRLVFWSIFIGLGSISLITGGLAGLLYTRRKEKQDLNDDQ